jgi:hypothetical protein
MLIFLMNKHLRKHQRLMFKAPTKYSRTIPRYVVDENYDDEKSYEISRKF